MSELEFGVTFRSKGPGLAPGARAAKTEIEGVKAAAKGAATETRDLGKATQATSTDLKAEARAASGAAREIGDLGKASDGAAGGKRSLAGAARAALGDVTGLGGGARLAAADLLGTGAAAESVGASLGTIGVAGGVVIGVIAAIGVALGAGVAAAGAYEERMRGIEQVVARAGAAVGETADDIVQSAARIGADTGRGFGDVEAAMLRLVETGRYSATQIDELTDLGAQMAATFGGDVTAATDDVARAFDAIGKGELKALDEGFGFLDDQVKFNILTLIDAGKTADAQRVFLEALNDQVHGKPGSLSSSFGELRSSIGDWVGQMLSSFGPIQKLRGWMADLSKSARDAARDVASATAAGGAGSRSLASGAKIRELSDGIERLEKVRGGLSLAGRQTLDVRLDQMRKDLGNARTDLSAANKELREVRGGSNSGAAAEARRLLQLRSALDDKEEQRRSRADRVSSGAARSGRRRAESEASKEARDEKNEAAKAARLAAAAERDLARDLDAVTRAYDPATVAANKYRDALADIARLEKAGKITAEQAGQFRVRAGIEQIEAEADAWDRQVKETAEDLGPAFQKALTEPLVDVEKVLEDGFKQAGKAGADELRDEGLIAARAIAQVLGGSVGGTLGKIIGIVEGLQTGNFNGIGGRLGGILTLLSGSRGSVASARATGTSQPNGTGLPAGGLGDIVRTTVDPIGTAIDGGFKKLLSVFDRSGKFQAVLGQISSALPQVAAVLAASSAVSKLLGNDEVKNGKFFGTFAPFLTAALGSALRGSATLGLVDGELAATNVKGNSKRYKAAATDSVNSLSGSIQSIADQLGGIVEGSRASVSVGVRKGKYVVDPTGQGRTKGPGVLKFGKDKAAAEAAALADVLSDGVIQGLSDKVASALRSSTDVDKAVREALKVDEVENLLAGFGGASRKAFVDFERQAKERLRIATKYGFDLVKLEAENAKQRTALLDDAIATATGGLKDLLEDLRSGERAPGTLLDRREALLKQKAELETLAPSDAAAAQKLASVLDQLYQVSEAAYGTAGAQFAGDRAGITSTAEAIIAEATRQLTAAQDLARSNAGTGADQTASLISAGNTHLSNIERLSDEQNAQLAQVVAALQKSGVQVPATGPVDYSSLATALNIGGNLF